jgi:hypothetical protein
LTCDTPVEKLGALPTEKAKLLSGSTTLYASGGHKRTRILHVSCTKSGRTPVPKRSFGQIRRLPLKRWQAFYTGPDTKLHYAPSTFEARIDPEGWLTDERRLIASGKWVAPAIRR